MTWSRLSSPPPTADAISPWLEVSPPSSFRSSPAQNARPAPVRTSTSTSPARGRFTKASRRDWRSSRERAFSACGRLRVSVATPSTTSTSSTGSDMARLVARAGPWCQPVPGVEVAAHSGLMRVHPQAARRVKRPDRVERDAEPPGNRCRIEERLPTVVHTPSLCPETHAQRDGRAVRTSRPRAPGWRHSSWSLHFNHRRGDVTRRSSASGDNAPRLGVVQAVAFFSARRSVAPARRRWGASGPVNPQQPAVPATTAKTHRP